MAGELFDELDQIICFGTSFHGSRAAGGGTTLATDTGVSLSMTGRSDGAPPDGWNRVTKFAGIPALTTTPEEAAAGHTWLNHAVWVGKSKRYLPYPPVGHGVMEIGPLVWPYRTLDGTVWFLEVYFPTTTQLEIYARNTPMYTSDFGPIAATLCASLAVTDSDADERWINFAPNGSLAALHLGYQTGGGEYSVAYIYDIAVSGGNFETPPAVSVSATFVPDDFNLTYSTDYADVTPSKKVEQTFVREFLADLLGIGFNQRYYEFSISVADDPDATLSTRTDRRRKLLGVVFDAENTRHILSHEQWHQDKQTLAMTASGWRYYQEPTGTYSLTVDGTHVSSIGGGYEYLDERILIDDTPAVSVRRLDNQRAGRTWHDGSGVWDVPYDAGSENTGTITQHFSAGTLAAVLACGDTGVIKYTLDGVQSLVGYGSTRYGAQYPDGSLPAMPTFLKFSTHPVTGVFDPAKDLYF